jgi:hypothetical protein
MKRLLVISCLILFAGIAFGQTNESDQVNIQEDITEINTLMDNLDFESILTEDALICGTDPTEFWDKHQFVEAMEQISNDPPEINSIGDLLIKVAPDGNSAIVVTQYIIAWSPKIPWRQAYHLIKTNEGWKVNFINVAFIPKNEHIETINNAIE